MLPSSLISLLNSSNSAAQLLFTSAGAPLAEITADFLENLINSQLSHQHYTTCDILSIIASRDPNLIETMLSLRNLQILVIDEAAQYQPGRINVSSSAACAAGLLEKAFACTNLKIFCAINRKGEVRPQFYEHLDKCLHLFDFSQRRNISRLCKYFFSSSKAQFEKIDKIFGVLEYLENIIDYGEANSSDENSLWTTKSIERLVYVNTNEISDDIFAVLFSNYHRFADFTTPGRPWLTSFFQKFERTYTSSELATVFCQELPVFCEEYYMCEKENYVSEFFEFAEHDAAETYQIFFEDNVFFVQLTNPKDLLQFVEERFFALRKLREKDEGYGVFGAAVEYLLAFKNLRGFSDDEREKLRVKPQEVLQQLQEMREQGFVFGSLPESVRKHVCERFLWETSGRVWDPAEYCEEESEEELN